MIYEWDEEKRSSNVRKHGLDFEDVAEVFDDPYGIEIIDDNDYDEERLIFVGLLNGVIVTAVVFVDRDENVKRIISFRKASAEERRLYENGYR
jgi:uncharacterized DUF497 family protein